MSDVFTGLLLLAWLAIGWVAVSILNLFSGAPVWIKAIASLVWFVIFLGGLFLLWKNPTIKDEPPPMMSAKTAGNNSPVYQAAGNITINNQGGLSPEDKAWFEKTAKQLNANDAPDDKSYPGLAFFFACRLREQPEHRRKFLFDFGASQTRGRFSAYMTEDNALAFRVIDQTGETNTIRVPRDQIRFATRTCWLFEIGQIDNRSFLRISRDGERLQSGIVNYPIDEKIFDAGSLTIFADMDGHNNGAGDFFDKGVVAGTLTNRQQTELLGKYYDDHH